MGLFVRDVMSRSFITCEFTAPLREVARRLHAARATAIVVLDAVGELAGVISRTDLARAFVSGDTYRTAEDVMSTRVVTIVPDIPVEAAVQLMLDKHIHQLVILHARPAPARPVGVLSTNDIVRLMAEADDHLVQDDTDATSL
jgi:CBS domain-containing protein